jgi:predicted metal-dependent phosphoesterase TrpH
MGVRPRVGIDLHSHTLASDGELTPAELIALAVSAGLKHLSITDHDTVAAIPDARRAAPTDLEVIAGIELSAWLNNREVHILGHFLDIAEPRLAQVSERLRVERRERMEAMLAKLAALGIRISMAQVESHAGGESLGRPHLAQALVDTGLCVDIKDAFSRYLGAGRPACVERAHVRSADAVALIRGAGGTATLAHPGTSKVERHEIAQLRAEGMVGLEVFHADHGPSVCDKYAGIAQQLDLVPTGGSDYHGPNVTPNRQLGLPGMSLADFERLRGLAAASRTPAGS